MKNSFYKDTFRFAVVLALILVFCKFTMGGAAVLVALMGATFALQRKSGYLAVCYILFPFFTIFNRTVTGMSPVFLMTARLGNLFMIAMMMLAGSAFAGSRARERLPLGWLFGYLLVACLSSLDGWMPLISYLKIFQLALFLVGLCLVTRLLQQDEKGLYQIRCAFMAFSLIMIVGSMLSRFVPSVGFSMNEASMASYHIESNAKEALAAGKMLLFNGLTHHSQMLPPTVSILGGWVLCDMLLIERRISWLHVSCLACVPVLLFMSRSRGGLLELVAVVMTAFFVCVPKARLSRLVKNRLSQMMLLAICALTAVAVVSQIRNQTISRWLRKTDDVGGDNRSLKEAFTGSRQALVEYNLSDFRRNPIFGMGFQVMPGMKQAYQAGMITWYSASIEKGVTPYVVLGETGVAGSFVFLIFLATFYGTCLKRRYLSLLTTFTCFFVANLADSTIFSPGGMGGFLWIVTCVGGFSTDLLAKRMNERRGMPLPVVPPPDFVRPRRKGVRS